jgi:hypothetical protein
MTDLALSRDSLVVYAALVIADHAPAVDVLARVDDVDHVQNCYDAGATYTLGLSTVTAHMVTARVVSPSSGEGDARHELLCTRAPGWWAEASGMLTFEGGQVSTSSQSNGGVTSTPTPVPGS